MVRDTPETVVVAEPVVAEPMEARVVQEPQVMPAVHVVAQAWSG